jgi:hypothetical protein
VTDTPFAKPDGLSDEGLFKARTEKVMFVNPPGSEHYNRVHGFGKASGAVRDESETHTRDSGHFRSFDRTKLRHLRGMEESLSLKGRPVK